MYSRSLAVEAVSLCPIDSSNEKMKSYLSKIGSIAKEIRREGLVVGGRKVFHSAKTLANLMRKAPPGDILYVAGGAMGNSTYYRVHNQKEELELHGLKCSVTAQDSPWLSTYADKFSLFIFHRVLFNRNVAKFIDSIKKLGKDILFETDDLIYDPYYLKFMDFYGELNALEKMQYQNGLGGEILNGAYVTTCITSTSYLAEKLREKGKQVFISTNKISNHESALAEDILKSSKKPEDGYIRIGYYSGTNTHNKDFAGITDALMEILGRYKNVKLLLAGPLSVEDRLNAFRDRLEILPRVPRDQYFWNIYKSDINLAPLELDNPFCEAKSEIKFTEPGILEIPTVAVRNRTFSEAIDDGEDGLLAGNTAEWIEQIGKLIQDAGLRRQIGKRAREKVLRDYTNPNSHNEEFYAYLRSRTAHSGR